MQDRPPNHPYIAASTAPFSADSLTPDRVRIRVGMRPAQMRLEGFDPRQTFEFRVTPGDERWRATPGADGSIEFDLAGMSVLEIAR
ncbi:MAG: hypothetical protein R3F11_12385 [Verrucomicrobiales bacterium]